MIPFPDLHFHSLKIENGRSERVEWARAVTEASRRWFQSGGDILTWLKAYQELRTCALKMGWNAYVSEDLHIRAHYIRLGSAGRGEDLLGSDLDFAIVTDGEIDVLEMKNSLQGFIRGMADLGFAPCQGYVMGSNPRWMGTVEEWEDRLNEYFVYPTWDHARYLFMILDGRPLHRCGKWTEKILSRVHRNIQRSPFLCWEMAHLGIRHSVPLDIWGHIKMKRVNHSEAFQLKSGLINPIIHSVRLLAVTHGFSGVSTLERLTWLESQLILDGAFVRDVQSALMFGWTLRVSEQLRILDEHPDGLLFSGDGEGGILWGTLTHLQQEEIIQHLKTAKRLERLVLQKFRKPLR